ncbi:NAD(P)H-binding protein [Carboxylicivirga sp. RSCT41]|uniref:NAD(P)H-binding protein n=1 Tax=Carboxylicivirga agarovorans TaxID=3417570 RepID=UPI003D342C5E
MKIAVTTASGHLGSSIINRLKATIGKENTIGIARTPDKAKHLGVEIRKGDYNSKADFISALEGIDAVLLVSGMDHPDNRIQQHRHVIEAAQANGVQKIVYTSIYGAEEGNAFSPIVASNRQTEADIRQSGLKWAIGRNGIYIEPDLEYIDTYIAEGGIINCAAEGKCGYTSRDELAYAYFKLLTEDSLQGGTYNLFGETITQQQLAEAINRHYNTNLAFKNISVDEYIANRQDALGDFLGTVIGGIYEGIRTGKFDGRSDFEKVASRSHKTLDEMIGDYRLVV